MTRMRLRSNGRLVEDAAAPRLSLADFLRERCNLTGTHLGCEHGVCGARTVLLDDEPVRLLPDLRSRLRGREVRTIEGFADDPIMTALRHAFHLHHGLQCGFCTPGMLITARDLIRRGRARSDERLTARNSPVTSVAAPVTQTS